LHLLIARVSDGAWSRILISRQMIQSRLFELLPAVNPIHHLQGSSLRVIPQASFQPANERFRFFHETKPNQGVEREGRISQPCKTIVPVANSSQALGQ